MGDLKMKKRILFTIVCTIIFLIGCSVNEQTNIEKSQESSEVNEVIEVSGDKEIFTLPEDFLQKNDENEKVSDLQRVLIEIGYPIEITGLYDELTTWAVTDIQLQHEELFVSGVYDSRTKTTIEQILEDNSNIRVGAGLEQPTHPNKYSNLIENPYEILVLVNKDHALPANFEPDDLVVPDVPFPFAENDPKKQLRKEAAQALEQLFAATEKAGLHLFAQSGFRSYDRQEVIFAANVEKHGEKHANTFSARAGESEHQSGLVMDVTSQEVNFQLITDFGNTDEGIWLKNNAHEYGFIIRYPEGKENITKYQYEPWHLRYVGKKAAKEMAANNLTLEEYLGVQ